MSPTRKEVLAGAAAAVLELKGAYGFVDRLAAVRPARPAALAQGPEQHLLEGVRVVRQDGVEVIVPPLHHEVVTARVIPGRAELKDAQAALERLLAALESEYEPTPAGLGVTVAWGLPYFDRFVADTARQHLPFDRRAERAALLDARLFPSDPEGTVLEENELAILLRSDRRAHIDDALARLQASGLLHVTSLRRGFAGGAFDGGDSLPRQMALAAGVPGAALIPPGAELFLGFTSTQQASIGPGKIANFETLGYVDLRESGYFREGTHMHLSHLHEDLEAWYRTFGYRERVAAAFHPDLTVPLNAQALPQGPQDISTAFEVRREFDVSGTIGHSASLQTSTRLLADTVGADGTRYPKGTAIPIRADFNTLDNPFLFADRPGVIKEGPAAGLHFVVFNPTSDDFARNRLAMDGVLPGGELALEARSRGQGFNSVLTTTHRQNFLVPPRRHRSFPLAEL